MIDMTSIFISLLSYDLTNYFCKQTMPLVASPLTNKQNIQHVSETHRAGLEMCSNNSPTQCLIPNHQILDASTASFTYLSISVHLAWPDDAISVTQRNVVKAGNLPSQNMTLTQHCWYLDICCA